MSASAQSVFSQTVDMSRLGSLAVSRNGFVFDPKSGQSFTVNATGLTTLELLQGGISAREIAVKLAEVYRVPLEVALGGVEGFLRQLARNLP
ncbi:MAG: PqqD family protein [Magnetococcales bacterium]|nr:PqqD family protein [Magnetococcales bacterium]